MLATPCPQVCGPHPPPPTPLNCTNWGGCLQSLRLCSQVFYWQPPPPPPPPPPRAKCTTLACSHLSTPYPPPPSCVYACDSVCVCDGGGGGECYRHNDVLLSAECAACLATVSANACSSCLRISANCLGEQDQHLWFAAGVSIEPRQKPLSAVCFTLVFHTTCTTSALSPSLLYLCLSQNLHTWTALSTGLIKLP